MLTQFLASRFAGPVVVGLGAATLAAGAATGVQTYRLHNSQALVSSQKQTIETQQSHIAELEALQENYKLTIETQNASIDGLAKAATAGREVYLTTYAKADERAKDHDDRAAELLAQTITQTDELAQCRAAKVLLEQELTK